MQAYHFFSQRLLIYAMKEDRSYSSVNFYKQDRRCKYNVTMRRFLATIVAAEKQQVLQDLSV